MFSILREQGLSRLLRGYDACICREAFFNAALLGSPAISRAVREHIVEPAAAKASAAEARGVSSGPNGLVAWLLGGRELLATSLRALYGPAAIYRALYTGHGVLALNFMRHKVETVVDRLQGWSVETPPAPVLRSRRLAPNV